MVALQRMVRRWIGIQSKVHRSEPRTHSVQRTASQCVWEDNILLEPPRRTPIAMECEVLVVGGGPAGLSAALASARTGADTVLVERYGCFGGCITTVGMETIGWYRYEGTVDTEGIGIEMERLAAQMGGTRKWPFNESECLDADYFKYVADQLVVENGVRPLLHTHVVDTIVTNNAITGVIVENKSGRQAIHARRVIDCSGDADVAYMSGCKCNVVDVDAMDATTVFSCSGVNKARFLAHVVQNPATYAAWTDAGWTQNALDIRTSSLKSPILKLPSTSSDQNHSSDHDPGGSDHNTTGVSFGGSWSSLSDAGEALNLNLVHLRNIDGTNVHDLTKGEMMGRAHVITAIKALRKDIPGFENAMLRNYAMTIGIRDTRKIVGMYNLTGFDVLHEARFEDSVGIFPEFLDGYSTLVLPTSGRYFHVPYGCVVPVGIDNLLVGGRCVAGDRISHAAMRNMMACTVTGQACGVAAAVSISLNKTTQNVPIAELQKELARQRVRYR